MSQNNFSFHKLAQVVEVHGSSSGNLHHFQYTRQTYKINVRIFARVKNR